MAEPMNNSNQPEFAHLDSNMLDNTANLSPVEHTQMLNSPQEQSPLPDLVTVAAETLPLVTEIFEQPEAKTIEIEHQQDSFSQNTDWFSLARKLRQHNRDLIKTVVQLEQALADSQEKLQGEIMRSRHTDSLIAQQTAELNSSHQQVTNLFRELEASHQTSQRQQILIEELSDQLQANQEHIAQLERECAIIQQAYHEQAQQLQQSVQEIEELRSQSVPQQLPLVSPPAEPEIAPQIEIASLETELEPEPEPELLTAQPQNQIAPSFLIARNRPIQPWSHQALETPVAETKSPIPEDIDDSFYWNNTVELPQIKAKLNSKSTNNHQVTASETAIAPNEHLEAHPVVIPQNPILEPEILNPIEETAIIAEIQEIATITETQLIIPVNTELVSANTTAPTTVSELEIDDNNWKKPPIVEKQPEKPHRQMMPPPSNWPAPLINIEDHQRRRQSVSSVELPPFTRHRS